MYKKMIVLTFVILTIAGSSVYAQRYDRGRNFNNNRMFCNSCIEMPKQDISEKEKSALIYMREEEKLARDVYLKLYEKWNVVVFKNIANSEEQHTRAIKRLLDKYEIADPVTDDAVGVFKDAEINRLYHNLVSTGETSLKDALIVGATIEDLDIFDLNQRIQDTDNDDIKCVFNNLKRGSENHMRAFYRQIDRQGASYEAQYISQQELDEILSSDSMRRGRGVGGRGRW